MTKAALIRNDYSQLGCLCTHQKQLGPLLTPTSSPASEKEKWRSYRILFPSDLLLHGHLCLFCSVRKAMQMKDLECSRSFHPGQSQFGLTAAQDPVCPLFSALPDTTFPWGEKPRQKLQSPCPWQDGASLPGSAPFSKFVPLTSRSASPAQTKIVSEMPLLVSSRSLMDNS